MNSFFILDTLEVVRTMRTMWWKRDKRIFLDYAAATPTSVAAQKAHDEARSLFANPQGQYHEGLAAHKVLEEARNTIARTMGVRSRELTFVSGGTEGNNLAIAGYLYALENRGVDLADCHAVMSAIEHPSVREVITPFSARGLQVTYVAPSREGVVQPESVQRALKENTVLVSVALVNSEIGTVQPLSAIAATLKKRTPRVGAVTLPKVMLHTDACQALYTSTVPHGLGVDMLVLDSGKYYGPRGIGVLYCVDGVTLLPLLRGGGQEGGLRPGTENVALAAGFAAAFDEATRMRQQSAERLHELREYARTRMHTHVPDAVVNGTARKQSPHIFNISIPDIDAEYIMLYLDQRGVAVATKSACLERDDEKESSVVASLTQSADRWRARAALRLSFGCATTRGDIERTMTLLAQAVATYRSFPTLKEV